MSEEQVQSAQHIVIPNGKELKQFLMDKRNEKNCGEVEIPARILDLLTSFLDSSLKAEYKHNQPPYRKLMKDGSYWQVTLLHSNVPATYGTLVVGVPWEGICIVVKTWKSTSEICLVEDNKAYVRINGEEFWSDAIATNIIFKSEKRRRRLALFDIIRKLKFYSFLISNLQKTVLNKNTCFIFLLLLFLYFLY